MILGLFGSSEFFTIDGLLAMESSTTDSGSKRWKSGFFLRIITLLNNFCTYTNYGVVGNTYCSD